MFRQSRFYAGLAAAVLACPLPSFVSGCGAASRQGCCLTGPLSGPQAAIGKDNENGLRMAIDQLNAQGLVVNGKAVRFSLVFRGRRWRSAHWRCRPPSAWWTGT
ncbi:hypothetical protein ACU4GD_10485 [Cupriavidus basilensis]